MSAEKGWKMYGWVPDGTYDNSTYLIRYVLRDGMPTFTMTKMWLDNGGPKDIPPELLLPWGTYPDTPPKPEKK